MPIKLHPPASAQSSITVYGRVYNPQAGVQDVPDSDAQILLANGWINAGAGVNTTQTGSSALQRPAKPKKGDAYIDNALGIVEKFDGKDWRNSITGAIIP